MAYEYLANIPDQVAKNIGEAQRTQAQAIANRKSERDLWRESKLKSILSKHRDEKGRLNYLAAMEDAKASELIPELRAAFYKAEGEEFTSRADIARNRSLLETMGAPSDVSLAIPAQGGQVAMPQMAPQGDPSGFATGEYPRDAEPPKPKIGPGGIVPEQVNVTAELPAMPVPQSTAMIGAPRGDIDEAMDYKPRSVGEMLGSVAGGKVTADDDPDLAWTPEDDASAFRKYGKSLESEAKATGITPTEMLRRVRDEAATKLLKPMPNQMLAMQGPEGLAKYTQQVAERALSEEQARAAGRKAIADYRAGLVGKSKDYGAVSVEEEKFEADMGGRRAGAGAGGIVRTRPVSETEKTQGEVIANSYQDLKSAKGRGGFEGDYAAAMARAKADGNVNEDAIIGHLVAMGAWPSTQALALKNLMRESAGAPVGDIYKLAKQKLGDPGDADPAKRIAWYKDSEENMRSAMQLKGYDIIPTAKEIGKMSPKDAREARRREFERSKIAKPKAWTSRPDGTEKAGDTYKGYTLGKDGGWH